MPALVFGLPAKVAAQTTPAGEIVLNRKNSAVGINLCVYVDETRACEGRHRVGFGFAVVPPTERPGRAPATATRKTNGHQR